MRDRLLLCALLLLTAASAMAQPVVVGTIDSDFPTSPGGPGPQTFVDLSHPANRDGSVSTATLVWSNVSQSANCTAALKIKFLRKGTGTFTVIAERGPFAVPAQGTAGPITVTLTPPMPLLAGDLIGVVQLLSNCGFPEFSMVGDRESLLRYRGIDFPGGSFAAGAEIVGGMALMARASSDPNVVAAVVPVVGSTAGGLAFFRTDVQGVNQSGATITGRYVFHPAGRSAAAGDPSITYSYSSFSVNPITDVVAAMGQTGLGSLDVVPTTGVPPTLLARIYSDGGTAGTSGFTEESMAPDRALTHNKVVVLISPADLTNFRMNVGVRSLDDGATIRVNAVGVDLTHTYPPNYFEQVTLAAFLGAAPTANARYGIIVESGSAFVYTSTTDNRTNDPSIQFITRPR
jgi:hypothetical protein